LCSAKPASLTTGNMPIRRASPDCCCQNSQGRITRRTAGTRSGVATRRAGSNSRKCGSPSNGLVFSDTSEG
jgi:hypothetical protein